MEPQSDKPFKRYDGAADTNVRRMPQAQLSATTSPRSIGELIGRLEKFTASDEERKLYPWANRFMLGYPLPPWQRELKWGLEEKVSFVTSAWNDVDLGSYLVQDQCDYIKNADGSLSTRFLSDVLLDGQQRLHTLQSYLLNEFAVPDADGVPCFWRDLGRVERRFFGNKTFSMSIVRCWDEAQLRHIYNLRAFSGIRHTENERA